MDPEELEQELDALKIRVAKLEKEVHQGRQEHLAFVSEMPSRISALESRTEIVESKKRGYLF